METKADTPVTKDGMTKALGVVTSKIDDLIALAPPEVASECTTFPSSSHRLLVFYCSFTARMEYWAPQLTFASNLFTFLSIQSNCMLSRSGTRT